MLENILKNNNLEQLKDKFKKDGLMLVYENFSFNIVTRNLTKTLKDGRIVYCEGFVSSYKQLSRFFEINHGIHIAGQRFCFYWNGNQLK